MNVGKITFTPKELLLALGYKYVELQSVSVDLFANTVTIKVEGDCELYPEIKPIEKRMAINRAF